MQTTIVENSFRVGDPVQSVHNPNILGRVCEVQHTRYDAYGGLLTLPTVLIDTIDKKARVMFFPEELKICRCENRNAFRLTNI
jgi:hypothetical protein